jgi:hypothetical protein
VGIRADSDDVVLLEEVEGFVFGLFLPDGINGAACYVAETQ